MNHSVYYSNKDSDDIASETWPDLLCTMEDSYPSVPQSTHPSQIFSHGYHTVGSYVPDINAADPYPSVPQSTYPDQVFASGCPTVGSYVPQFNTANYAAFSLPPATEMEAFANLLPLDLHPRADFTTQVSNQCVGTSTWTYPDAPQDVIDPWSMPALCMFPFCICHDPPYSLYANQKPPMRISWFPNRNRLTTSIGQELIPLPLIRWLQHLT